jgi:hypothetical protein
VPWARIGPPPVSWGETLCSADHCAELAELTLDGWPFCLACGDDALERILAWELHPELVGMLPDLADR